MNAPIEVDTADPIETIAALRREIAEKDELIAAYRALIEAWNECADVTLRKIAAS